MRRLTGSALAVVLVVVIGREARAQSVVTARGPGGFGQEYTQSPPSNSVLLDRWWMLEMTPAVGSCRWDRRTRRSRPLPPRRRLVRPGRPDRCPG